MRSWLSLFLAIVIVALTSNAQAVITGWQCADDGDNAVRCTASFNYDVYKLVIDGVQKEVPGHVVGGFTTDTEQDPTVLNSVSLVNDTTFSWTEFIVSVTTNKTFTLSDADVSIPDDWTASMVQPVQVGSNWVGAVDLLAGTPVDVGDTLAFSYKMSFLGSIQFCQEMTPVPEPSTLALLAIGGLGALVVLRRKRA
jgi:hypothetical protein